MLHQWLCFSWDNLHRCGEPLHNWWGKRGKLLRYDAFFLKHNITTCNLLPSAHNMSPSLIRPSVLRCAQVGPPSPRGKACVLPSNTPTNRNLTHHKSSTIGMRGITAGVRNELAAGPCPPGKSKFDGKDRKPASCPYRAKQSFVISLRALSGRGMMGEIGFS